MGGNPRVQDPRIQECKSCESKPPGNPRIQECKSWKFENLGPGKSKNPRMQILEIRESRSWNIQESKIQERKSWKFENLGPGKSKNPRMQILGWHRTLRTPILNINLIISFTEMRRKATEAWRLQRLPRAPPVAIPSFYNSLCRATDRGGCRGLEAAEGAEGATCRYTFFL